MTAPVTTAPVTTPPVTTPPVTTAPARGATDGAAGAMRALTLLSVVAVAALSTGVAAPWLGRLTAADVTDGTGVAAPSAAALVQPADISAVAGYRNAAVTPSSAVTVAGTGAFAGLKVTVAQTRDLIDQSVSVSWTGGRPTNDPTAFDVDYLQIMQCWGEAATGPERTQCEFGGTTAFDQRGGQNSASRQLTTSSYQDAKDPLLTGATGNVFVPFVSVTGATVSGIDTLKNQFYDNTTTNEITYARTRANGTGQVFFETMTYREAPGLGCGQKLTSGAKAGRPRSCWLVVVPRGQTEVDGTSRASVLAQGSHRLDTSPLSTTNWAARLVVPLQFVPVGNVCPLASAERETAGVESAAEAVLRWQPALCANNGPVFGYSQTPDATAQRTLATDTPGLVFVNGPAGPPPSDRVYRYAPVAVSGLAIAVSIDRQSAPLAKDHTRDGEPVAQLNLTQRLVAKLLTQSYRFGAPGNGTANYLQSNVDNITLDPDFRAANPDLTSATFSGGLDLIAPLGNSDATALLWQWVTADQSAADWLAGLPDPWGMRVNPFYQGMSLPRPDFPKVDPYCATPVDGAPPLCSLDEHPYAQDLHEAARSAARGDSLSRTFWDANAKPPTWKKRSLQLLGRRQLLAVTDTATAARYGLVTARLRNSVGAFVAPTRSALSSALTVARPSGTTAVVTADPASSRATAYPLPLVTYAVAAPSILTVADAKAYAGFIRYAVGTGQTPGLAPGTLPEGYLPLPTSMRTAALTAATAIQKRVGPPPVAGAGSSSTSSSRSTGSTGTGGSGSTAPGTGGSTTTPAAEPTPTGTPSDLPTTTPSAGDGSSANPITSTGATADDESAGRSRFALAVSLILGLAAALVGPALPRLARRLRS